MAKLLDFCLVKDPHAADGGMTHDETITGTPLYMSPESLRSPDDVGPRSDVYSLGAVANFLVTGMPLFSGNTIFEICASLQRAGAAIAAARWCLQTSKR